ncbi:MAG: SurA N-terminal domain-containing protein, partial [Omnitrophica bacterium]|nr:SurA N-terminal domain-containing protein [Candidatus Omnitrophota bacterium]
MNFRKNKRSYLQIVLIGLVCVLYTNLFAQTIDGSTALRIDRIVAVVNEEVITQSELNRVVATLKVKLKSMFTNPEELARKIKEAEENIINQMVEERLILSEAKKFEIKVNPEKLEARLEGVKQGFNNEKEFEQALDAQGLTLEDLKR